MTQWPRQVLMITKMGVKYFVGLSLRRKPDVFNKKETVQKSKFNNVTIRDATNTDFAGYPANLLGPDTEYPATF